MKRPARLAVGLLAVVAVLWLALTGALWAWQDRLIFPGWSGPTAAQIEGVPGLRELITPGPDGMSLRAWYRPADPGRETIVLFHGNAGTDWRKTTEFARRGFGVYLTAYRGYAGNPGTPSADGLLADAGAMLDFALGAWSILPEETILYGESLGTGIAARMAAEPGAWRLVVLDAPYTSLADRAAETYPFVPVRSLIRHDLDTAGIIAGIDAPLLILHGTEDEVIPVAHGRALFTAAGEPKRGVWIEGDDHFLPASRIADEIEAALAGMAR
jgi:fermentation-respiration switch protein FrsA (DUF1100 family)